MLFCLGSVLSVRADEFRVNLERCLRICSEPWAFGFLKFRQVFLSFVVRQGDDGGGEINGANRAPDTGVPLQQGEFHAFLHRCLLNLCFHHTTNTVFGLKPQRLPGSNSTHYFRFVFSILAVKSFVLRYIREIEVRKDMLRVASIRIF